MSKTEKVNKMDSPRGKTIIDLFQEQVEKNGKNPAIVYENTSYNYEELNERANQVAHFLLNKVGIEREEKVGLLLKSGIDTIASMLGILKAGGVYVPMNCDLPEDHLLFVISDVRMRILITEKEFIEIANRLQWTENNLTHYLCIDSNDVRSEREYNENVMMSQELWDYVGERADDAIAGGGWLSSYTGLAIPEVEVEEFVMNTYHKLKGSLHSGMRVLEIGCSSGFTLSKIAPEVAFYYGTDLSPVIISNTRKLIAQKGFKNVKLKHLVAHDISKLEERDFDLIIINSVIHNFHGHNYFLKVIRDSTALLKEKGMIFIGDVMDLNKKKNLIEDMEAFKMQNKDKDYTTKTDFSSNLFVSRGYFEDLIIDEKEIVEVVVSEKIRTIENELTKFRYDVILHIDKSHQKTVTKVAIDKQQNNKARKHKWQYSRTDLDSKSVYNPKITISPSQLACITYISDDVRIGERTMLEHGVIAGMFKTDSPLFNFQERNVWTMFRSDDSVFSVWEMYGALFFGNKLILVPSLITQDALAYLELIERERVTVINQTPTAFYDLPKEEIFKRKLDVCHLIFRPEAFDSIKQHCRDCYPACKFINMQEVTEIVGPTRHTDPTLEEKHQLLHDFNDSKVEYVRGKTIVSLFEEQVDRTPNSIAVIYKENRLSYYQLNKLSNQLANFIRENYDIKSNDLVGMLLDRNEWIIVTILAILKTGATYVPIDPEYPSRKRQIIEDASLKLLITEEDFINDMDYYKSELLIIDTMLDIENCNPENLSLEISINNLAYIIYTSGSTGNPKGVMVSSRSLVDYSFGVLCKTNLNECKSFGLVSTIAADLGNTVIYTSLLIGATLHIVEKDEVFNVNKLLDINLDCLKITPTHWRALQTSGFFVPNKCLILGGEQFPEELLRDIKLNNTICEVYNHYGPTETTIGKLIKHVDKSQSNFKISLGKPMGNNQVYVLNTTQQLCPIGVTGEICISGDGLARGYLNQEEYTKEKFIANPFKEGERMYRTGDLGRWLSDGNIEFIGRIDDQVKIRGYRIEPGEIEYALLKNENIKEAVVLARENQNKEKELVAYITAKSEQNTSELRVCLKTIIPEYMVPAYFVQIDKFPLTSNGKIDRKTLSNTEGMILKSGLDYVGPRNDIEKIVVKIWQEVLQRENIGIKDDFFSLGGNSIKAMKIISLTQNLLNHKLEIQKMFTNPSIENICLEIENIRWINENKDKSEVQKIII